MLLPYDVVGPNSTIICPAGHAVRIVYIATKGFWVPVTTPSIRDEGELGPDPLGPDPHPAIKAHAINDAIATRVAFTAHNASSFFLIGN